MKSTFPKLKWITTLADQGIVIDKEFQQKNISGMKIKFESSLKDHHLIAEVMNDIDPDEASRLFKNKSQMIKGLYSIQATPYTGSITKEAGCIEDLQIDPPLLENKIQSSLLFNLKATERMILGVCIEEQNVYRSQTLMLYCKNANTFYEIKYFYPKILKPLLIPIASCLN